MSEIIDINGSKVSIGLSNGSIAEVPIASIGYANPQIGDEVRVYKNDDRVVVRLANDSRNQSQAGSANTNQGYSAVEKRMNKHVFCWVGAFLFGGFGVDRFMRGQVGIGICKLLFGWLTLGLWALIDWAIALSKAYGTFSDSEEVVFINGKYAK